MSGTTPTQIIILGGGGDLSKRKLLPALFDLFGRRMLPKDFAIIGAARSSRSNEEYRNFVRKSIATHVATYPRGEQEIAAFCDHISYVSGAFDEAGLYATLAEEMARVDAVKGVRCNRLFYLAVPPKHYGEIFVALKECGLAEEVDGTWSHILVEKPFGHDFETAQALDTQLASLYREEQIFRIDHYLAKEAVQNLLSFRFANRITQAPWNRDSIESVTITMTETIDVGDRAGFYEGVGALRDVGQNHLLQLLALTAMREPPVFTTDAIRNARVEALRALRPISKDELGKRLLRAQYEGYEEQLQVSDSDTETYFELMVELGMAEWEGVPFYLRAGKALDAAEVSVVIKFKDVASGMFETNSCQSIGNVIKLTISPEQTIDMTLNAKAPGIGFQLEPRTLSFVCNKGDVEIKNSYEKVLYDSIMGDQTLFTKTEEVLAAWEFITPILHDWHDQPLHRYEKGSGGPKATIIPK